MIALYLFSAATFYVAMSRTAKPMEETQATHPVPESHLQWVPGGKMLKIVDGGVCEDQRAA